MVRMMEAPEPRQLGHRGPFTHNFAVRFEVFRCRAVEKKHAGASRAVLFRDAKLISLSLGLRLTTRTVALKDGNTVFADHNGAIGIELGREIRQKGYLLHASDHKRLGQMPTFHAR
jgi:hypothetical protein